MTTLVRTLLIIRTKRCMDRARTFEGLHRLCLLKYSLIIGRI